MRTIFSTALLGLAVVVSSATQAAGNSLAHAHIGHVMTEWNDTPERAGLMSTAIDEAKTALIHATAASQKTAALEWMQMHSAHVMHAVDPTRTSSGPGKGYGVIKAAKAVVKHINAAAASVDASAAVKTHALHVATTAATTIERAAAILELAQQIMAAQDAAAAAPRVARMQQLAQQLLDGADANGDGEISWHEGEGGLNESNKHARILLNLEGLSG